MATIKPLKKPLQEPIWEKQEVISSDKEKVEYESPKQRFFFDLFCRHGGFLSHFIREMQGRKRGDFFLGIKLKYAPFSASTFEDLCAVHEWISRRTAKEHYVHEYNKKQFDIIDSENAIELYQLKRDTEHEVWIKINGLVKVDPKFIGGRLKDATQGANNIQANKNIDKGVDSDNDSKNEDIETEVPYVPVEDNPLHESKETREFWNDILWDLVDKRQ